MTADRHGFSCILLQQHGSRQRRATNSQGIHLAVRLHRDAAARPMDFRMNRDPSQWNESRYVSALEGLADNQHNASALSKTAPPVQGNRTVNSLPF